MEGWQKGAPAVLKMSAPAKQNYFKQFPEREAWFRSSYPEHFGRSAAVATSSLNKVVKAKVKKQRLAAIRQAVAKRDQLKVSSDAVRAMGERRRESGEGLAGGMDTVADIRKSIAAGMPVRSGGLGSLYEAEQKTDNTEKNQNDQNNEFAVDLLNRAGLKANNVTDNIKDIYNKLMSAGKKPKKSTPQPSQGGLVSAENPAGMALPPDKATGFRDPISGTSVDGVTPNPKETKGPLVYRSRPEHGEDPKWEKLFKPESEGGGANPHDAYIDDIEDKQKYITKRQFRTPAEVEASTRRGVDPSVKLDPEEKTTFLKRIFQNAGYIEDKGMYENTKEFAKQLAQKIIEQKRLQECMPMVMSMGSKKSSESEDESGEYDYEGDMAKSQLRSIAYNSQMLHDMLEDNTNLPEWVQSKITLAEDYIMTAANYMRGELSEEVVLIYEKVIELKDNGQNYPSNHDYITHDSYGDWTGRITPKKDYDYVISNQPTYSFKLDGQDHNIFHHPKNYTLHHIISHSDADSLTRYRGHLDPKGIQYQETKYNSIEGKETNEQFKQIDEKINLMKAKMGDVIKDFQDSDAPQFKGKSKEKRRQMAIAAKLSADRGSKMDEAAQKPNMTLNQAKKDPRYMSDPAFKAEVDKAEAFASGFNQSNDLVKPSMLPDTPTIPQGQGMGDDIAAKKKEKILNKTKVAVDKKQGNYDMINRGGLPDAPPANMQEENEASQEEVVQEPIQEQTSVSDNPYVASATRFLNNTSNRLLYGERK